MLAHASIAALTAVTDHVDVATIVPVVIVADAMTDLVVVAEVPRGIASSVLNGVSLEIVSSD